MLLFMCVSFGIAISIDARAKQSKQFDVAGRLRSNTKESITTTPPAKLVKRKCAIQTGSAAEAEELSPDGARKQ